MRLILPRPFARSLSLRLLAIFVLTGAACLIVLVLLSTRGLSGQWQRSIQPHLQQYVAYVQQDLGNPPSLARADAIAGSVPVDIALYRDAALVHATRGWIPDIERRRFRALPSGRFALGRPAHRNGRCRCRGRSTPRGAGRRRGCTDWFAGPCGKSKKRGSSGFRVGDVAS